MRAALTEKHVAVGNADMLLAGVELAVPVTMLTAPGTVERLSSRENDFSPRLDLNAAWRHNLSPVSAPFGGLSLRNSYGTLVPGGIPGARRR